jgi:hypothetical protein
MQKVNTWITGIMIPGNYATDRPSGTLLGWDADFGDIVALDGVLATVADYKKARGHKARVLKKLIDQITYDVNCSRGAPMGRADVGKRPKDKRILDNKVPMDRDGCYDRGGAYWGIGAQLRVRYTKDLSFIEFYRKE